MESFNEPALTLMTEGVSDGKLICLRESEMGSKRFMCVCVCTCGNFGVQSGCVFAGRYPMRIPRLADQRHFEHAQSI